MASSPSESLNSLIRWTTVSGLTITHGSAQFGGGVNATGTDLTLDGDVITANTSVRDGGGVSGYNHGSIDIKGTTISGNTSHEDGGGGAFYHLSSVTVTGSSVTNNTAIGKNSDGGGLYVYPRVVADESTVTVEQN